MKNNTLQIHLHTNLLGFETILGVESEEFFIAIEDDFITTIFLRFLDRMGNQSATYPLSFVSIPDRNIF
jgi:hypothetical protein